MVNIQGRAPDDTRRPSLLGVTGRKILSKFTGRGRRVRVVEGFCYRTTVPDRLFFCDRQDLPSERSKQNGESSSAKPKEAFRR